jgi:hypothetical protein
MDKVGLNMFSDTCRETVERRRGIWLKVLQTPKSDVQFFLLFTIHNEYVATCYKQYTLALFLGDNYPDNASLQDLRFTKCAGREWSMNTER